MLSELAATLILGANLIHGPANGVNPDSNRWYGPSYQPRWWDPSLHSARMSSRHFGYKGTFGPQNWPAMFPDCGGKNQSPININTTSILFRKTKKPLVWTNYRNVPQQMTMKNSGHSLHVTGAWSYESEIPFISKGPLSGTYAFSQLHFHWGRNNSFGSEHTINGKSFPLEMHVVHAKTGEGTLNGGRAAKDGIAVVSYMFKISRHDNPALSNMMDGIKSLRGATEGKATTRLKPFHLHLLCLEFSSDYLVYRGSLTTPPCTEGTIWIISSRQLPISQRQVNIIRSSIKTNSGDCLENFRPTQEVNTRNLYYIQH